MLSTHSRRELARVLQGAAVLEIGNALDLIDGPGDTYFVDSNNGSSSASGLQWSDPLATWDAAINKCQANHNDKIILSAGHAESLSAAAAAALDVAGVRVIGLGHGSARPTFTFDTSTAASLAISGNGSYLENILFLGGIDELAAPIAITGTDVTLKDCEFRDVTGQATDVIIATGADRLLLDGHRHIGAAADGGDTAVCLVDCDDVVIRNSDFYGNFDLGAIQCRTTASARLKVHDCFIWTEGAEDLCIVDTVTGSTGVMGPNLFLVLQDDAANVTEAITGATFYVMDVGVHVVNAVDQKSLAINWTPVADS